MIRTWPGQTKEEWLKERERDAALTSEESDREMYEYIKQIDEKWTKIKSENEQKQTVKEMFKNYDHPNSLENDEVTIIWFIVMAIATIFNGNWIIWIVATIIWRKYITRHKIKK